MGLLNKGWGKYLLLLPVLFLAVEAVFFQSALRQFEETMLKEKYLEVKTTIDTLAVAVEAYPDRTWTEHERNVTSAAEFIDGLNQVYGAAYKFIDGELTLMTKRVESLDEDMIEDVVFDPFIYEEFIGMVLIKNSGDAVLHYEPYYSKPYDLHVYFRWMPVYSGDSEERFLILGGVSAYSIATPMPVWISMGLWVSMVVTFAMNITMVIIVIKLGHIWVSRSGVKWRRKK